MLIIRSAISLTDVCSIQVNTKAAGKAAVHCAAVAGNIPVLKCLLEYEADLEIEVIKIVWWSFIMTCSCFSLSFSQDEDGDKPLHLCAFG